MSELRSSMLNSTRDTGIKGPQRDIYNNVIREEQQQNTHRLIDDPKNPGQKIRDPNDDTIDDGDIEDIWQNIRSNNKTDTTQQQQQQQQTVKTDPAEQLKQYLKEQGLGEFVISEDTKKQLQEGNFDAFNNQVLGLVQQAHVKALSGAQTLIKSEVAKAVKAAVDESKGYISGQEALRALNTALPFTKDKAVGPVAQSVMQRFIDRGASQEEAIKGTGLFFKRVAKLADLDGQVNPSRNQNYRGGNVEQDEGSMNWIDLLSPSSR